MKKYCLTILAFLVITLTGFSQDISVVAQAPEVVEVGEQFQVNYIINAQPSGIIAPEMKNFQLLMGPSQGSSSYTQIINGKVSTKVSFTYSYVFAATTPGKYVIGGAEVTVNGKKYKSNSLTIEVVGSAKPQNQQSQNNQQNNTQSVEASNDDVFIRVLVDKKNVYLGEYLTATVKIYTRLNIAQLGRGLPSYNGFYVQNIDLPQQSWQRENVNGKIYHAAVMQKSILIPQKSGQVKIDAFDTECIVQKEVQSRSRGFFDDFFTDVQNIKMNLKSLPVIINVKPLPDNKPESFNGAVGKFNMEATIDKNTVKANDAITLKLVLSGTGNIKLIDAPKFNFPEDFEVYDPQIKVNTSGASGHITGNKTIEYLLIPRNPGKYTINPVSFSYFDLATNQYKTYTSKEFVIDVAKGDDSQAANIVTGRTKEEIKFLRKDLIFIKERNTPLLKINSYFFGSIYYYLILIAGIIIFISIIVLRRHIIRQNSNKALVRNRKADKFATKRLHQAKIHLAANEKEKFYEEIIKAVWGYLGDKLNIATSELSRDNAAEILTNKGVEPELIKQFFDLIENCEFARYAPVSGDSSLNDDYQKAIHLITKLQQKLK